MINLNIAKQELIIALKKVIDPFDDFRHSELELRNLTDAVY
jgi:hypothetical protein